MQKISNEQVVNLVNLDQGHKATIVLTGDSLGSCNLEFRHGDDETFRPHPEFTGTPTNGVILEEVLVVSGRMRINFDAPPGADYYLTVTQHVENAY